MFEDMQGGQKGVSVGSPLDCEFEQQSYYFVHFRANILGKYINSFIQTRYGLSSITTVLVQEWLWHQIIQAGCYAIIPNHGSLKVINVMKAADRYDYSLHSYTKTI